MKQVICLDRETGGYGYPTGVAGILCLDAFLAAHSWQATEERCSCNVISSLLALLVVFGDFVALFSLGFFIF